MILDFRRLEHFASLCGNHSKSLQNATCVMMTYISLVEPIEWAEKGVRKEDHVLPWLKRMARRDAYGVYFIFRSMEQGPTYRVSLPKYPSKDPHYRILARQRSRFTHYYFYIRDEALGPMVVPSASFLPFQTTYYHQRPQLHRAGAEAGGDRLSQARQRLPCRRRPGGVAGGGRPAEPGDYPPAARLLDADPRAEVLGRRARPAQPVTPLRHRAGRVLPQSSSSSGTFCGDARHPNAFSGRDQTPALRWPC